VPAPGEGAATKGLGGRLWAVDVLRGLVIALMTVDHASEAFNAGRLFTDSAFFYKAGTPLPAAQFFTRWITHLCAPTFVLLAGVALAISSERRAARGESQASIGRHVLVRGLLLVAFEVFWMSPVMLAPGRVLFQVLYALGGSLVCMSFLRRLPDRALFGLGLALAIGSEAVVGLLSAAGVARTIPAALLFSGGFFFDRKWIIAYPLVPWLSIMCLGWALGRQILAWGQDAPRRAAPSLAAAGVLSVMSFVVLRGVDGYGNMMLHRDDASLVQWLHVSKYPPSVTFITLEIGLAALVLAALFALDARRPGFARPLALLGQASLFYYLLHIHLLKLAAWALGVADKLGLGATWLAAAVALVALFPVCVRYQRYKAAHPASLARYV
jgi:uncharacterized membrane protein